MARGAIAKEQVEKIIQEAFGDNYLGCFDKKLYVTADDGGQKVQIAITLTCPKNEIEVAAPATPIKNGGWDFEAPAVSSVTGQVGAEPAEITEQEQQNLAILLANIGL
jgi:hypothetical protein